MSKSGQRCGLHFQEVPFAPGEMSGEECRRKARQPWWEQQGMKGAALGGAEGMEGSGQLEPVPVSSAGPWVPRQSLAPALLHSRPA